MFLHDKGKDKDDEKNFHFPCEMALRVAIVPGNGGSDSYQGNWYPWLANELAMAGMEVALKQMPDPRKRRAKTPKSIANFTQQKQKTHVDSLSLSISLSLSVSVSRVHQLWREPQFGYRL